MDKFELLGFFLQDLRDNHGPDEEDIDNAILRETTKIFDLLIHHGYLSRDMFELAGIDGRRGGHVVPKRYSKYRTTNYPITFVVFANCFEDWLLTKDARERLTLIDVVEMIRDSLRIKVASGIDGAVVTVRSEKFSEPKFHEVAFVEC